MHVAIQCYGTTIIGMKGSVWHVRLFNGFNRHECYGTHSFGLSGGGQGDNASLGVGVNEGYFTLTIATSSYLNP